MNHRLIITIGVVIIIGVIVVIFSEPFVIFLFEISTPNPNLPSQEEILDDLLIDKAENLEEVKVFRQRYQNPDVFVERLEALDVIYQKTEAQFKGKPYNGTSEVPPYIALRVRFDEAVMLVDILLWCTNDVDGQYKIRERIVQYLQNDDCF